jgi:hypothetical protein
LRQLSEPGSTARDVGTLLMLLWLPIIGNVIAWLIAKVRRPVSAEPAGFEAGLHIPRLMPSSSSRCAHPNSPPRTH